MSRAAGCNVKIPSCKLIYLYMEPFVTSSISLVPNARSPKFKHQTAHTKLPSHVTPCVPEHVGGTLTFQQLKDCAYVDNFIMLQLMCHTASLWYLRHFSPKNYNRMQLGWPSDKLSRPSNSSDHRTRMQGPWSPHFDGRPSFLMVASVYPRVSRAASWSNPTAQQN